MPTLRQKPDGRFYIDYYDGAKRRRIAVIYNGQPVRDRVIAEIWFDEWLKRQTPAAPMGAGAPRVSAALDYYRDVHLRANNAAAASVAAAQTHCAAFLEWCRSEHIGTMQQVNRAVMARWLASIMRDRSARTARNYVQTIRAAFNAAAEAGVIPSNPVVKPTLPKLDDVERHPLTLAELSDIAARFADMPIVQWICWTGNRPSDARTLRFRDVDVQARTVDRRSVKSRALRQYEICSHAAGLVAAAGQRAHAPDDIVFLNARNRPWTDNDLLKVFKRRLVSQTYPRALNLRDLRHSFASAMANEIGIPVTELRVLLGHSDITMTMKYVHARGCRQWLDALESRIKTT